MIIEVNKDIDRYKETVVLGLTARQLIFSIASVVVGGGIVLLVYPYVGLTVSAYIAIPAVAPIALNGFYSYNGMTFMQMMKKKLHFAFANKPVTYISTEGEAEVEAIRLAEATEDKKKRKNRLNEGSKEDFETAKKGMVKTLIFLIFAVFAMAGAVIWYKYFR
ncbi:MAG: PrgI family protein [Lachnospiraceae bacterium]|nr:PrgI family protein [Lachnospiraceae bacterium]